ncbi:MAG: SDR family oxidoreductase [Dehalococcoidia bacterium]|nr:SDR family oxidoreductase [Dehalococcoidia bacterium]
MSCKTRHRNRYFPRPKLAKRIPAGKIGDVEDIANAVVFLASEQARYISISLKAVGFSTLQ